MAGEDDRAPRDGRDDRAVGLADGDVRAPSGRDSLLTSTDIMDILADALRPQDMPSPKQLVAALRSAGFRSGAQEGKHGWYARRREG